MIIFLFWSEFVSLWFLELPHYKGKLKITSCQSVIPAKFVDNKTKPASVGDAICDLFYQTWPGLSNLKISKLLLAIIFLDCNLVFFGAEERLSATSGTAKRESWSNALPRGQHPSSVVTNGLSSRLTAHSFLGATGKTVCQIYLSGTQPYPCEAKSW